MRTVPNLTLLLFLVVFPALGLQNCFFDQSKIVKNLSTKTPYAFVLENLLEQDDGRSQCIPKQLWMLARHGTRYPSDSGLDAMKFGMRKLVEKMLVSYKDGKSRLCAKDIDAVSLWANETYLNLSENDQLREKNLHSEGELENILMAERFQKRFPQLFDSNYSPNYFKFRATKEQRAVKSQFYFATGLFNRKVAQTDVVYEEPVMPHDSIIRFYKTCPKWITNVKKSPISLTEQRNFENSPLFRDKVIASLSNRLGFDVSLTDVDTMYVSCVFSQAWRPTQSVLPCQIFTEDELDILEYREDLEYYWQDGYGFEMNHEPACVLIKDVIENFESLIQNASTYRGVFYFSHSGTILKFLSFLGLYKDGTPLRANNFEEMNDRLWRTSVIDPFAANIAFVLRHCPQSDHYEVGLFHNERLALIPGCSKLWCNLKEFETVFEESLLRCHLPTICETSDDQLGLSSTIDDRF